MVTQTSSSAPADDTQQIKIRLEVTYALRDGKSILDATAAAKSLVEVAREHGEVEGQMIFGRQKFPIG